MLVPLLVTCFSPSGVVAHICGSRAPVTMNVPLEGAVMTPSYANVFSFGLTAMSARLPDA